MIKKEGKKDLLQYYIFDNRENAGACAAKDIGDTILKCLEEKEEINMIFAAAPSQNETLAMLMSRSDIPWNRIHAFHMDEYIGLPLGAPQSFGNYLKQTVFDKADFKSVNYINANAVDVAEECARYTKLLEEYPVDIVCLGIGENGHIAFNDPGVADFNDPVLVKAVTLDEVCRQQQVNDGCFSTIDDVPAQALTLTIPALVQGTHLFCTVPAASKRRAVKETLCSPISEACPATIIRNHKHAILYCDSQSGADLL